MVFEEYLDELVFDFPGVDDGGRISGISESQVQMMGSLLDFQSHHTIMRRLQHSAAGPGVQIPVTDEGKKKFELGPFSRHVKEQVKLWG